MRFKKHSKLLILALAALVMAFAFTGCSNEPKQEAEPTAAPVVSQTGEETVDAEPTAATTAKPTAKPKKGKNPKMNADEMDIKAIIEDKAAEGKANIYHWWTAGGEKDAIESIISGFGSVYSAINARSNAIPGGAGGAMVMKVKVLQQTGKSPEAFQAHPGQEIEPYLASDMLLDLGKVWEYANVKERLLPGLEEMCTASDGKQHIVPVGIHKTNVIYYNKHVFAKYGVEIPDHENITWDEFWAICDQLAAKMPEGEYPIDLGDRKGWPACQVFEDIMIGTDAQLYEDFINGKATIEQVQGVLDTYKKLLTYVAPDHSSRDWFETSGQVVAGTYAMQIMGSWMQPLMTSMGQTYGEDYGVFTFPGTDGYFGLNIDGFVVSNDSADVEAGIRWAYNVTTTNVQVAFSGLKESISPYTDTPDSAYPTRTLLDKQELVNSETKVYPSFTHGTALPWSASTDLQTRIQDFAVASDPDTARYARNIVVALQESGLEGDWNIVD